ncbi:putative lipoprotein [Desulfobulbus propionicus DSM 2032]|uniref:Lipoprotein n=1 Tax=Desulfobulbus propionicus (strain ATCC 33891 / DSM 2032 / VKM B-1956 / 1pr3) TaxID=577650 RepID=A0A7U3YP68_DESPD|nr:DUF4881 domain-containing protein [Desulfobulbus propionicus]ADW18992.1 putative lipoprotein [Desulfobulbus propionicus DSM 2032]
MNVKQILLTMAAAAMAMTLTACKEDYGKVEQGRAIAFDKDKKEVTLIHDSAMDPQKPVYDVLPPSVFKLPTDPKETGPEPKAGQRLKLDTDKKIIVIFDTNTQKIVEVPITIVDLQQPVDKEHPLVYDKAEKKAKKFPAVDKEKKTITIYSGRQKMLCTFSVPDQYFSYPDSTWDAGDEVRLYYKTAGQSLRFMNISKTDIFKK